MEIYRRLLLIGILIIVLAFLVSYILGMYSKFFVNSHVDLIWIHALIVAVAGILIIEIIGKTIKDRVKSKNNETKVVGDLFEVIAYTVLLIVILNELQINVMGLLVGAGFLGIVLGLAAQSTIGNLIAGFELMASRPFSIGEKVTISTWQYGLIAPTYQHDVMVPGFTGTVNKIGIMYTEMLADNGTPIVVPNSIMNQAVIFNKKRVGKIRVFSHVEIDIKIDYGKFKSYFNELASKDTLKNVSIEIKNITQLAFGVDIYADGSLDDEPKIKDKLSEYALMAISRIMKEEEAAKDKDKDNSKDNGVQAKK